MKCTRCQKQTYAQFKLCLDCRMYMRQVNKQLYKPKKPKKPWDLNIGTTG